MVETLVLKAIFKAKALAMCARATIYPSPHFNATTSAEMLEKAMDGMGCNHDKVIQALCTVCNYQRREIALQFKSMFGKDLVDELRSELGGDFEKLIVALMEPRAEFDARQIHDAISGIGTSENVLIEVLVTRNNVEIYSIRQAYRQLFERELEGDLAGDTSGDFQRLLVSLSAGARDESEHVDHLLANQDARKLLRAGDLMTGTDERVFNVILATRNFAHLRAVFVEYEKVAEGRTIDQAIHDEFSGSIRDALLAVVKCARSRIAFLAELIHDAIEGFGTRDSDLIRLVVSRSEIDLADIRDEFSRQFHQGLVEAIAADCSGSYKEALVALVKGN